MKPHKYSSLVAVVLSVLSVSEQMQDEPQFSMTADEVAKRYPLEWSDNPTGSLRRFRNNRVSSIAAIFQLRRTLELQNVFQKDVDIFVWKLGPPAEPWHTKFGGVPYMDEKDSWPSSKGLPLKFFCQLYLGDSRDVIRKEVGGDLIQVFLMHEGSFFDSEVCGGDVVIRVLDHASVESPIDRVVADFEFKEISGVRIRTIDYESTDVFSIAGREGAARKVLSSFWATKIGGLPPRYRRDIRTQFDPNNLPIFYLYGVQLLEGRTGTLVDRELPETHELESYSTNIYFGDDYCIGFRLMPNGSWRIEYVE